MATLTRYYHSVLAVDFQEIKSGLLDCCSPAQSILVDRPSETVPLHREELRYKPRSHDDSNPGSNHTKCQSCSYNRAPLTNSLGHSHFSTKHIHNFARDPSGISYCPSCKLVHSQNQNCRIKLCMSDSTLHMFWDPPHGSQHSVRYEGDSHHTDYVTIPGAKIETLQQAFMIDYSEETRGIDVLVVAGLNNILRGDTMEQLMRTVYLFRDTVLKKSK